MVKMRLLIVVLGLLVVTNVRAQWTDISLEEFSQAILDVEKRIPEGESYHFKADYFFFEYLNSTDTTQRLSMELTYHSKTKTLNFYQLGKFIVQTKDIQITCDTAYQSLILNNPNLEYNKRKGTEDFKMLLASKCTAKKRISGKYEVYYLEFAPNASLKAAEIWIEKNGMVKKYIMYTGREILDDSGEVDKMIQPRMEVVYSDYSFGATADKKAIVGSEKYFKDLKNKVLQKEFEGYEVVDLRE
jgi:hypothetical protein